MNDKPTLQQAVEARRELATHVELPRTYWALYAVALVAMAGIPIWTSFLPLDTGYISWGLVAVVLAATAYSVITRYRSGVHLPRHIGAYPSARRIHLAVLAIALGGFCGMYTLVANGHRTIALIALVPLVVFVLAGQYRIRTLMRDDVASGRVAL
ncbi:hypothetical protein [Pseudonocardia sp. HH130630-07]|uniref:hypothetical protein n=1 Tax=Pseudonocardia sp. HH130630-07 TaxID=1690815 RepID=UPI000814D9B6|nr:hypothetical protein [Pseudonocardia sp. HH130630-07]ANY06649.1 hypothetical protein AFB00_10470 [Pseudonocardia sp. HH130630-07]